MKLQGKTALITGGSSGIGLAAAKLFINEGARVAIMGRRQDALDQAAADLGSACLPIQVDVSDLSTIENAVRQVGERWGKIDIVVANAALNGVTPLGSTTIDQFETVVRTNLTSIFFLVQASLPFLPDHGAIVTVSSINEVIGSPGWSAYAATKGGIRSMTRCMASELSPRGIRVNTVTPGATRTPIWSSVAKPEDYDALEKALVRTIPLRRVAEAEDVAKAILFLASDDACSMQAAEIVVDGGTSGAPFGSPVHQDPVA